MNAATEWIFSFAFHKFPGLKLAFAGRRYRVDSLAKRAPRLHLGMLESDYPHSDSTWPHTRKRAIDFSLMFPTRMHGESLN
jgi:hypothetical protein